MTWDASRLVQNYRNAISYKEQKYSRNSDRKQIENTKGLTEGQKLLGRPQKIQKKL